MTEFLARFTENDFSLTVSCSDLVDTLLTVKDLMTKHSAVLSYSMFSVSTTGPCSTITSTCEVGHNVVV
jgi:hypothetical protein